MQFLYKNTCSKRAKGTEKIVTTMLIACLIAGCDLLTLSEDLQKLSKESILGGELENANNSNGSSIFIIARNESSKKVASYSSFIPKKSVHSFFFLLPYGSYSVTAFQDDNGDRKHNAGEATAFANDGAALIVSPGYERFDLSMTLQPNDVQDEHLNLNAVHFDKFNPGAPLSPNRVVSVDDPMFSAENAKMGLWQPSEFLRTIMGGLYLLQRYDPNKTPVIYVHGAMGHPGEFKSALRGLDTTRYQPWVYYYPTAIGLEDVSGYLAWFIYQQQSEHGFNEAVVVAHSAGGLVALRATQLLAHHLGEYNPIRQFISISTPWNGHKGAMIGAELAPVPAPSWLDMSPNSPFLNALRETGIPTNVEHSLLFSYHGDDSLGDKADGSVTLASQLDNHYQKNAGRVIGFDETHTSILTAEGSLNTLNALLNEATP